MTANQIKIAYIMELTTVARDRDLAILGKKVVARCRQAKFHVDQNPRNCSDRARQPKQECDPDALRMLDHPCRCREDASACISIRTGKDSSSNLRHST